ncbi:hypothetical protein [Thermosulfurimonas sp. F29]|uniref:hypothetical protein n=1 Tax=Thermosulfurimonas sp. F29 TaxID=2867247 RepID=UPI001C83CE5A|nr:hypothetical protein [Thermosulfurimonas sp. F29]MBX6422949.1 hypothetical protein [Thermosulfurimonas sp. F29]
MRGRFSCLLVLGFLLFITGCERSPLKPRVIFGPLGLEVYGVPEGTRAELLSANGTILLRYPPLPTENLLLIHPWTPGATYVLRLNGKTFPLRAPKSRVLAELEVFAPLGSPGRRYILYRDGTLSPVNVSDTRLVLFSPNRYPEIGLLITGYAPRLTVELSGRKIELSGECARRLFRLRPDLSRSPQKLILKINGHALEFRLERRFFDPARRVHLLAWHIPTEESGLRVRHRREGLLALPNPLFERLGYLLGLKNRGFSRYEPFAYQTVWLQNESDIPLNLVVETEFTDLSGRKVKGFYPPRWGSGGHVKKPLALVYLPPRGRARAVLPVYVRDVPPGEYRVRVKVRVLGEKHPFLVRERRIGVTRGSTALAAGLLLIMGSGLAFTLVLIFRLRALLAAFSLRELSLVALSGAVAFGLDFLGGLASTVLYAILGPFNILVGGLITEVVHYLVFTAVFILVPKPGFATLSGLLHYLMGTILFGGLRATDPFFLGARLLALETALLLFRAYGNPSGTRTAVALAFADAANTLSSLVLHMAFYRLFFPGWYLWLSVTVKGFLYTLMGSLLGLRLGRTLREIER